MQVMDTELITIRDPPKAGASLFIKEAISVHIWDKDLLNLLEIRGFDMKKIDSMRRCGDETGRRIISNCNGKGKHWKTFNATYQCNVKTCPRCSKKRRRFLYRDLVPFLESYHVDRNSINSLKFLTISPEIYENLKEGRKKARYDLKKFLRSKYVRDRVKGGIWTEEAPFVKKGDPIYNAIGEKIGEHKGTGWHIHYHLIIYGRKLDNHIRGKCLDCGQSLLKFDTIGKNYYCANRSCNSIRVVLKNNGNSKIVTLFNKISGRENHLYISELATRGHIVNYISKSLNYVGKTDNNEDLEKYAEFIQESNKTKLINKFGVFCVKIAKQYNKCNDCEGDLSYIADCNEVQDWYIEKFKGVGNPNRDLNEFY